VILRATSILEGQKEDKVMIRGITLIKYNDKSSYLGFTNYHMH